MNNPVFIPNELEASKTHLNEIDIIHYRLAGHTLGLIPVEYLLHPTFQPRLWTICYGCDFTSYLIDLVM